MREQWVYDRDGDVITFSPEDKQAIEEEINLIDTELAGACTEPLCNELARQRRQLAAELVAGHILPMHDEE